MTVLNSKSEATNAFVPPAREAQLQASPLVFCALAFLVSRAFLITVGYLGYTGQLLPLSSDHAMNMVLTNPLLDMWFAWDSNWYLTIVTQGYQTQAGMEVGSGFNQANWAFFPLYPWLSTVFSTSTGISGAVSLLVVANIAFAAALCLVYLEVRDLAGDNAANIAVTLLLVWPGTHFFSSAYTEALFLLLVVATFRLARQERFLSAAVVAALAAVTRSPGIMLVFPLAFYAWAAWATTNDRSQTIQSLLAFTFSREGFQTLLLCCLPVAALVAFMTHLYLVTGDALAFVSVQEAWGRDARNPLMEFARPFVAPSTIPVAQWPDYITMWLLPVPLYLLFRQRNWPHFSFALFLCLLAITAGVVSLNRQTLVMFPIITIIATLLSQNRLLAQTFFALAGVSSLALMAFWSAGYGIV